VQGTLSIFIVLQTRHQDWQAGGLNTEFYLMYKGDNLCNFVVLDETSRLASWWSEH
jgi:hypothetical protein